MIKRIVMIILSSILASASIVTMAIMEFEQYGSVYLSTFLGGVAALLYFVFKPIADNEH